MNRPAPLIPPAHNTPADPPLTLAVVAAEVGVGTDAGEAEDLVLADAPFRTRGAHALVPVQA